MDEPEVPFRFGDLPPELQSKILRTEPSLRNTSIRVDKPVYRESIHQLLEDECQRDITPKEVNKYLDDYRPLLLGKTYFSKVKNTWVHVTKITHQPKKGSPESLTIDSYFALVRPLGRRGTVILGDLDRDAATNLMTYYFGGVTPSEMGSRTSIDENFQDPLEYDLTTTYYCLRERLSCMNLNSKFAKTFILRKFEDSMTSSNSNDLLVYLRSNAKIMGINVKGFKSRYIEVREPTELLNVKVSEEVNLLAPQIRQRLELLN